MSFVVVVVKAGVVGFIFFDDDDDDDGEEDEEEDVEAAPHRADAAAEKTAKDMKCLGESEEKWNAREILSPRGRRR